MTKAQAKKDLLRVILIDLTYSDDMIPHDLPDPSPERRAYERARDELVEEFERRVGER